MASLARCLNQTLVQQSQEEAEWFQFCQPAVETKKEGKASLSLKRLTASDSIFGLDILQNPNKQNPRFSVPYSDLECHTQSLLLLLTCSSQSNVITKCYVLTKLVYSLTKFHSTLQRLLRIETGWMVSRWLCSSGTSTFATSAISGVLNGLRIKRVQLCAEFAFLCLWQLIAKFRLRCFDVSNFFVDFLLMHLPKNGLWVQVLLSQSLYRQLF